MSAPENRSSPTGSPALLARLEGVSLHYADTVAIDDIDLELPAGKTIGFIGPDGVGKSSILALLSGARSIQSGRIDLLGGSLTDAAHRSALLPRIAYMPQGLGKNLYPTLSVRENAHFFALLFGQDGEMRERRIDRLLRATGLAPFIHRPAGRLSGGMKQKLSLCCSLVHDPDLLILDEPTTGVDPLSRRQFWELIDSIRAERPGMSVLVATAYMEEAAGFDLLVAMDSGRILAHGAPRELLERAGARNLEEAFITLLPPERREGHRPVELLPMSRGTGGDLAIEARDLTKRFGSFTAVDHVSFEIRRGEIFGFLGSNGCGKTTTMKMLTGLLPASEGVARLFGERLLAGDVATRRRVGYMTQAFSLYRELTVRQNLELHARLFGIPSERRFSRVHQMARRFSLGPIMDKVPMDLPLGERQRLSLAVAMIHEPEMLILDEPTSGVDPVARDGFWNVLLELARRDGVTVFISTHFMNEAERCDRISLMHAGKVLVSDTPERIIHHKGTKTLEEAFISHLEDAQSVDEDTLDEPTSRTEQRPEGPAAALPSTSSPWFSLRRLLSYALCEALELRRDPIRLTMAAVGSAVLMLVLGFGISMDVNDLSFAVLDRDQTHLSRDYVLSLGGSRYFDEGPPLQSYADLDRRMCDGRLSLALEIPPGFARDVARGRTVSLGAWIDGAMPSRAETVKGYVVGMHHRWLADHERGMRGTTARPAMNVQTRFRYNPDVSSLPAMVPAVIPLLLLLFPAILTALSVAREKELGSIVNLYVTPVTRLEFFLGKQLPYVLFAVLNFLLLSAMAVFIFEVPVTGSFLFLLVAAMVYAFDTTAIGLLISTFVHSQTSALFGTAILTLVPATQFSGMLDPVSSLEGLPRIVGEVYPTAHFMTIVRGTFSKGLGLTELQDSFLLLLVAAPILTVVGTLLLDVQER